MYSSSTIIATFTTIHSQLIQLKERAGGFRIIIIIIFFFSIRIVLSSKHCIIPLFIFSYFIVGMCSSCFSFSRLLILLLLFFYIHQTTWKWLHELYCSCCRRFANTCGRQTKPFFFPAPSGVRVHAHSESASASIYVALLYHSAFLRPVCFLHHFYLCGLIRESPALIIIVVCYLNISVSFRFV